MRIPIRPSRNARTKGVKHISVDGGGVIQAFLDAGLVTDMTISIVPVLLADGVPLFPMRSADIGLDLVEKL